MSYMELVLEQALRAGDSLATQGHVQQQQGTQGNPWITIGP